MECNYLGISGSDISYPYHCSIFFFPIIGLYVAGWFRWFLEIVCGIACLYCSVIIPIRYCNGLGYHDLKARYKDKMNVSIFIRVCLQTFFSMHLPPNELKKLPATLSLLGPISTRQPLKQDNPNHGFRSWTDVIAFCDGFEVFMHFLSQEVSAENLLFVTGTYTYCLYVFFFFKKKCLLQFWMFMLGYNIYLKECRQLFACYEQLVNKNEMPGSKVRYLLCIIFFT
ncbi:hypothetical protein RFI_00158 [Reticulomyxa filosa]|uniref:Uncharacterized protein n=1 Tax=Reticulomyxa filosa TaxID=46433 RepID=X6PFW4_RETFI|nr:hypothetical protein RFI_00158 [Reticulomyxa filosa]|eukprot:ETO36904.1 hypothetical protein RFI_00158 [Reticulomyxa filosa]